MNFPVRVARRYLFAKRSTNAINIIAGIAVFAISIGAAALILVLSVFNGFEDLITEMYSSFDPDVKVSPVRGKTFPVDSVFLAQLHEIEGVSEISQTLEEVAFFEYDNNQDFGTLKGVDQHFRSVTGIDSTVREGVYQLSDGARPLAVMGLGMRNKLGVNVNDLFTGISVYMPKRERVGPFEQPFRTRLLYPAGTFVIQQEFNNQYILSPIDFARNLLGLDQEVSALEIRLTPGTDAGQAVGAISRLLGPDYRVEDRYQQEESFLKLMKVEKWLSYAIVSLMMLLVAFNMIGALWMIVLEKRRDIAIMKSMGATGKTIRNIFLNQGLMLCFLGLLSGFILALLVYGAQKGFGLIEIPGDFIVDAYPISMRLTDFLVVALTVLLIGLLASLPAAMKARRIPAMVREE
ncbi:MAG: FtsX-like permease family protein [Saprospiraceae bacterium]|nr:FtsX-like permease family protein [Saprospiraceae bacterium]